MADRFTYRTGMSKQPIDYFSGAKKLLGTAVEQKLLDIEQGRAMATESQKAVLDAMSMKTIQGLDRNLQGQYQKDFDEHRNKIIEMTKESGGVLSLPQQTQIRNEREDLIQKTMASNEAMKSRNEVRKFLLDPNTQYGYDVGGIANELKEWDESFARGEYLGDPKTILFKHQVEAPVSGYVSKNYSDAINALDVEALGEYEGNVFTETKLSGLSVGAQEGIDKARRLRDVMMQDPSVVRRYTDANGVEIPEKKADVQAQIEDTISQRIQKTQKGYTSRSTGTSKYKSAVDYTPSAFNYKGNDYSIVRIPSNISQTDRNFFVNEAKNLDSGKTEKLTQDNAKIVGVDVDKGVMLLEGKGGNAENNGEVVFIQKGTPPIRGKRGWVAQTEAQLSNAEFQKETLKDMYVGGGGKEKVKGIKNVTKTPIENGFILSGVIETKRGDVPVEKTFISFTDPTSTAIYEAPLWTNKEAVTNMFSKVFIKKKPLEKYFDEYDSKPKEDKSKNGQGYFGALRTKDGRDVTEMSIGIKLDGKEVQVPMLVPTLDSFELRYILGTPIDDIVTSDVGLYASISRKAHQHAVKRIRNGKSPFATKEEEGATENPIEAMAKLKGEYSKNGGSSKNKYGI